MRFLMMFLCCLLSSASYALESLAGTFQQDPGVLLIESYQYEDAERYFNEQLAAQSDRYKLSLLYLAKLAVLRDDGQKAVHFIEQSLAIEPHGVAEMMLAGDAYCTRAMQVSMFRALGLGRKCGYWYSKAAETFPEHITALRTAIEFHLEAPSIAGGSMKTARQLLDKLVALSEEDARILQVSFIKANDGAQQAVVEANRLSTKPFTNPRTAYDFAVFFKQQKKPEQAMTLFNQLLEERAKGAESWHITDALFQVGDMLLTSGSNTGEGIALLEQYVAASTDIYDRHYFWSRLRLAEAYQARGDTLKHKDLVAFIQSSNYSHDSDFKKALDAHVAN
ncbi:tetratricopeptide repeat protein [Alkalimonas mucilaginosa]|uniref:Tetratricopeptide repeat-containing protein n=1 Tax=Alkalimonas mucilaginosa TaxID=3057676 RepID=A0ABU7JBA6_9GAMM|nr:hypothetical protein [Alkalimonas sp. MEB004]MEE2022969.1 hypothetical protein [Alkalimonas sp. MEB004]